MRKVNSRTRRTTLTLTLAAMAALAATLFAGCQTVNDSPVKRLSFGWDDKVVDQVQVVSTEDIRGTLPTREEPEQEYSEEREVDILVDDYRIGAGDVLEFLHFNDPALSTTVQVRYDGRISLPLIPDIHVLGATREEAIELVRDAFLAEFQDPQVSLAVSQPASKYFVVMGSVSRPAEYPYTRALTLLDAINMAGGPRIHQRGGDAFVGQQGQLTKALVIRDHGTNREVLQYGLTELARPGPHPSEAAIYPGDIVYVPEGVNLIYLLGAVGRPGVYELTEGMTMLQLLARAGGMNESIGRLRQVVLMRDINETETAVMLVNVRRVLNTGADIPLQAGDVIYTPRKRLTILSEFVQRFTSSVTPLMNLYKNAYDTYYTDQRYRRLFDDDRYGPTNLLTIDQIVRDLATINRLGAALP